jgi:Protein of unknown function (DUF1570)
MSISPPRPLPNRANLATILLMTALLPGLGWAQEPASEEPAPDGAGPAPAARDPGLSIPQGVVPKATGGEPLLVSSALGESQVVRSYCDLGDHLLVMLPTGALAVVKRADTQATEQPFKLASRTAMDKALDAAGFEGYKRVPAKPYYFVYACSEAFYLHTRSILESMLPGVLTQLRDWGLEAPDPSLPLVVVITKGRAEYDAYRKMPEEAIAYYNTLTNYVVLYEDQELWEAAPEFAAKQGAYTVAHESIHQLLANTSVERRLSDWPMWISEGLPEFFCPLKVNSSLVRKGTAQLPVRTIKWARPGMVNDLRMFSLLRLSGGSGEALRNLLQSSELDADGYAISWGLVHYLANEHPTKFQAYLKDVSKMKPLDLMNRQQAGRPDPLFVKHFGDDFELLERGVQEHLLSRKMQEEYKDPIANQTHYLVRRVQKRGRTFEVELVVTTSPAAARKWKEEQEAVFKRSTFSTKICKNRREAEFEIARLQAR